jgi:hypothetical protein
MTQSTLTDAFARYGAKLKNRNWAVSAVAPDGSIVISCWGHYFKQVKNGVWPYVDTLSRWQGTNANGNKLLREHLERAVAEQTTIRLVLAQTDDKAGVDRGEDASKFNNTFGAREDVAGKVTLFDGDKFVIEFRRKAAPA